MSEEEKNVPSSDGLSEQLQPEQAPQTPWGLVVVLAVVLVGLIAAGLLTGR